MSQQISGYTYGTSAVAKSPVSLADFELMQKSALFGEEDFTTSCERRKYFTDQVEAILDVWYGFVGSPATSTPIVPR